MAKALGILAWRGCRKGRHRWKENVVLLYLFLMVATGVCLDDNGNDRWCGVGGGRGEGYGQVGNDQWMTNFSEKSEALEHLEEPGSDR